MLEYSRWKYLVILLVLALSVLYARYRLLVFGCLCRLTPDRSIAEDLLQETFVAAWQSAGRYNGQGSVRSWVVGIARNQAAFHLLRDGRIRI